ncbi:unnamed protein product [Prunus armeniaca]|uniref:Uncharacterized protein n=1 Tax=Prunus armeniaca TaxID=36596 RepID=A0A6J5WR69_PRUAR|nr:unnamed protein product [Prunus armeniaca]
MSFGSQTEYLVHLGAGIFVVSKLPTTIEGVIVKLGGSPHSELLLEAKEEATSRSCIQLFVMHASMAIGMLVLNSASCHNLLVSFLP